jgi:predicted MPP superfamily phosphohydrolase
MIKNKLIAISLMALVGCSGNTKVDQVTTTTIKENKTKTIEPITIVAVGDIACSSSQRESKQYPCKDIEVAKLAESLKPNILMLLGDIQYQSHSVKDFNENFGKYWNINSIAEKVLPIPGNHEYDGDVENTYFTIWNGYTSNKGYYYKEINNEWSLIALNTNDNCEVVSCDIDSEQYSWFESKLKSSNECSIVMTHHPRYSSGIHGSNDSVNDLFELMINYNVEMLLSGHDHHYESFNSNLNGARYPEQFVIGTGGKDLRKTVTIEDNSRFITDKDHGVLYIKIHNKTIETMFVTIDGKILDYNLSSCY